MLKLVLASGSLFILPTFISPQPPNFPPWFNGTRRELTSYTSDAGRQYMYPDLLLYGLFFFYFLLVVDLFVKSTDTKRRGWLALGVVRQEGEAHRQSQWANNARYWLCCARNIERDIDRWFVNLDKTFAAQNATLIN